MDLQYHDALCLEKLGRDEEAYALFMKVTQSAPGFLPVYPELLKLAAARDPPKAPLIAEAYDRAKKAREGIKACEARIQALPLENSGEAYLELGTLYRALKDPAAFDYFFLASDLLPESAEACNQILSGLTQSQDVFIRARFLRRLLTLEPQNDSIFLALVEIYAKLHVRLDEAWRMAERAVELKPSAKSFRLQGEVALERGEKERALEVFRRGLEKFPSDAELKNSETKAKETGLVPPR